MPQIVNLNGPVLPFGIPAKRDMDLQHKHIVRCLALYSGWSHESVVDQRR